MTFGQRVRERRRERELTLRSLAEACGLSVAYLSDVERGRTRPSLKTLVRIAAALGTTPSDLMAGTEALGDVTHDALPAGLQELAQNPQWAEHLDEEWLRTLSRVDYRGRRPETAEEWLELYLSLRRILGHRRE